MGYINYKLLYEKGLSDQDFHILQKIFQKEEILLEAFKEHFKRFEELGLVQYLKGQEDTVKGIRTSKKGNDLLNNLGIMSYNDNIGKLVDELISSYESRNKSTGTKLEIKNRLTWFIGQTGFGTKVIANIVEEYLVDNPEYTKNLENLIWKPQSVAFSVHKNLKESELYSIICKKYGLDDTFYLEARDKRNFKWLFNMASLDVVRGMDKSYYMTGSYKGDLEYKEKMMLELLNKLGVGEESIELFEEAE